MANAGKIGVRLDLFWTPVFIGLFLVLLALKLWVYPNMYWTIVGSPLYLPPIISLGAALYQKWKYLKKLLENPF